MNKQIFSTAFGSNEPKAFGGVEPAQTAIHPSRRLIIGCARLGGDIGVRPMLDMAHEVLQAHGPFDCASASVFLLFLFCHILNKSLLTTLRKTSKKTLAIPAFAQLSTSRNLTG